MDNKRISASQRAVGFLRGQREHFLSGGSGITMRIRGRDIVEISSLLLRATRPTELVHLLYLLGEMCQVRIQRTSPHYSYCALVLFLSSDHNTPPT